MKIRKVKENIVLLSRSTPVGALSTHLKMQPLVQMVLLSESVVGNKPLGIIVIDEISDDGARLP